jgi:hypothetical protein
VELAHKPARLHAHRSHRIEFIEDDALASDDKIINPELERWYYARAKGHTIEIKGASHAVYESHAKEVAAVITGAARNAQK